MEVLTLSCRSFQKQHWLLIAGMVCCLQFLPGCGGGDGPEMVESVSGTVMMDGSAVHPATVEFWLDSQAHSAVIDESGSFQFEAPLPAGSYQVSIGQPPPPEAPTDNTPPPQADVPEKYRLPANSGLTAEVSADSTSFEFQLEP